MTAQDLLGPDEFELREADAQTVLFEIAFVVRDDLVVPFHRPTVVGFRNVLRGKTSEQCWSRTAAPSILSRSRIAPRCVMSGAATGRARSSSLSSSCSSWQAS